MSAVEVTIAELEDCGHDEVVRLDWMSVDHSYQRPIDESRVKRMGSFNGGLFGRLTVNRRADRSLWVVDGQHRLAMARRNGLKHVPCTVYEGWTVPQEAWVFHYKNGLSVKVSAYDQHRAALGHLDPMALEIEAIVAEIGGAIGNRNSPHTGTIDRISCIDTLKSIYKIQNTPRGRSPVARNSINGGPEHLRKTLHVLADMWGNVPYADGDTKPFHGAVVKGMAIFLWNAIADANFDEQKLVKYLRIESPQKLMSMASGRTNMALSRAVAISIRQLYNKKAPRNKLSEEWEMGDLPH